jgi:hypothetical protein
MAVEMLSGEKKRLPLCVRNWLYRSMAKALLPSTTAARSDVAVADGGVSAGNLLIDRIRHMRNILNKNFIRFS